MKEKAYNCLESCISGLFSWTQVTHYINSSYSVPGPLFMSAVTSFKVKFNILLLQEAISDKLIPSPH